jgi:hypothetical protein
MKKIQVLEMPPCQGENCTEDGKYDVPTVQGPWGNFCIYHVAVYCSEGAKDIGYERTLEPIEEEPRSAQLTQFANDMALEDEELAMLMEDMGITEEDLFG